MRAIRKALTSSFHYGKDRDKDKEKSSRENASTNTLATAETTATTATTTTTATPTSSTNEARDEKHVQFKHTSIVDSASDVNRAASPNPPSLVASASASRLPMSPSTSSSASGTWSGMVQFDLVENLSQRERTRQEVLWEIVASEMRFVDDLTSLYERYISKMGANLPEKMKNLMNSLAINILPNHVSLSKDLKARHDAQYPLIRSLADIFLIHSHNLQYYSTYVLHLEYTLSVVDDAINLASKGVVNKRSEKYDRWKLGTRLIALEDEAQANGCASLAICLLHPFQRLLKYPLLFRGLLFNSDPSMIEYEATLKMVEQVESIVRSIEDKKIQIEERDKTRDALARIEGIEKERSLMAPKPGRLLVREVCITPSTNPPTSFKVKHGSMPPPQRPQVIKKSSLRRLSDLLPNSNSQSPLSQGSNAEDRNKYTKKDLWQVEFNDVTLLCQRSGRTTLPIASNSQGKGVSEKPTAKRSSLTSTSTSNRSDSTSAGVGVTGRNLYRFIKVCRYYCLQSESPTKTAHQISKWNIADQSEEGIVSMNAIMRNRSGSEDASSTSPLHRKQLPFPSPSPFPSTSPRSSTLQRQYSDDARSHASIKTKVSFSYERGDEMVPRVRLRPKPARGCVGDGVSEQEENKEEEEKGEGEGNREGGGFQEQQKQMVKLKQKQQKQQQHQKQQDQQEQRRQNEAERLEQQRKQEQRRAAAKFGTRLRPSNASQTSINVVHERPSSRATTAGQPAQKEVVVHRTLTPQPPPTSSRAKLDAVNRSSGKVQRKRVQLYDEKLPRGVNDRNDENDKNGNRVKTATFDKAEKAKHGEHSEHSEEDKEDENTSSTPNTANGSISSSSSMDTHTNTRTPRHRKSRAASEDSGMLLARVAQQYLAQSEVGQ
ncbi:hypothetical protein E3P86_00523 [Wallemia ichthyophaga]|uniref:DH domain-containing protein n=1 Tax=Wallemia ichthyophaga TaxID=245174 RepID=A0A4T0JFT9_WALIC|nr:hypothetical protein E3P86_00523 [Wallemia ichthyophaga]